MNDLLDPLGKFLADLIRGEAGAVRFFLIALAGVALLLAVGAALIAAIASGLVR